MDGVPQNGAVHTQQQHNIASPFDPNQHHHQSQHHHTYYQQQQQQYDPAPYAQAQQPQHHYYHQQQPQQSHNEPVHSPVQQQQHQQYYSNHQEAWGNANNLQAYAYYNQQPQQQTYQHHHQQPLQQQAPPPQQHQQQDESLAHLSRFVNQPPVNTAHASGMPMSQQQQRGPTPTGNMGRPGPGSSPGSSGMQLMPVRLQNVKGARTKAGMRKLIQEQSLTPAPASIPACSVPPAKKKKLFKDSYDEAIEAIVESSSGHASPTSELEHSLTAKPKKGRPKRKPEQDPCQSPIIVVKQKKAALRRDSEVDAAQLLLDLKGSPPAKVQTKAIRRSVSQEKKASAPSPLMVESKKNLKRELEEHEHEIIRKEMVPAPESSKNSEAPLKSKIRKKKKGNVELSNHPSTVSSLPEFKPASLASNSEDPMDNKSELPVTKRIRNVRRQTSESPAQSQVKTVTHTPTPPGKKERSPKRLTPKPEESTIKSESPDIEIVQIITKAASTPRGEVKAVNSNTSPKTERERKPKGRPKGSKTKNRRVLPGAGKKNNPSELSPKFSSSSAVSTTTPATTPRHKPAVGLLDRRAMFKGPRVPTVKRVESASSIGVKKNNPKVPIVGPSIRVKNGKVKFYRGSDEEDVDEPLKKLLPARDPIGKSKSAKIKVDDTDGPWICVFCKLGPHAVQLGDLFGPYFVQSSRNGTTPKRETWVHTDCALWAGDVFLVGDTLRNLDSAVEEADDIACKICSKDGATIGCIKRGCSETSHYPCAQQNGWNLDENTYHSYCRSHAAMASNVQSSRK